MFPLVFEGNMRRPSVVSARHGSIDEQADAALATMGSVNYHACTYLYTELPFELRFAVESRSGLEVSS